MAGWLAGWFGWLAGIATLIVLCVAGIGVGVGAGMRLMRAWEALVGRQAAPIVAMFGDDLSSNKEACLAGGAPAARLAVPLHECVVSVCSWCRHDGVCAEADQAGGAGRAGESTVAHRQMLLKFAHFVEV